MGIFIPGLITILVKKFLMRRKKKERLEEERFWSDFFYFNIPDNVDVVPEHVEKVNFRRYNADDRGLERMVEYVRSVGMLDLDGTDVTDAGMQHLEKLDLVRELRLKGCRDITDACVPTLNRLKGLELLHVRGTLITPQGLLGLDAQPALRMLLLAADEEKDVAVLRQLRNLLPGPEIIVNGRDIENLI